MNIFKSFLVAVASVVVLSGMAPATSFAAGTASFTLSPSAGSVTQGQTFSVAIVENGTDVNVVTAKLAFDASQIQLLGFDTANSAFSNGVEETNGITRYANGGAVVSGSVHVAAANFKALGAAGTTNISIANSSHIVSGGVEAWDGALNGTSVALSAPALQPGNTEPGPTPDATPDPAKPATARNQPGTSTRRPAATTQTVTSGAAVTTPATVEAKTETATQPKQGNKEATVLGATDTDAVKAATKTPWVLIAVALAVVSAAALVVRKTSGIAAMEVAPPAYAAAGSRGSAAKKRPAAKKAAGAAKARQTKISTKR
jgi:hypothetical protein